MGTDINIYVEVFDKEHNKWKPAKADTDPWEGRNYAVFGWLAGVRNYSAVEPKFPGRGIPADTSYEDTDSFGQHSATHFTVQELLEVDYLQTVEDRRTTVLKEGVWDGRSTSTAGYGTIKLLIEFLGEDFIQGVINLARIGDPRYTRVIVSFDS